MRSASKILLALSLALFALMPARAAWWERHPGYLHAMSDLRTAYWMLQHHDAGDPEMYRAQRASMNDIRAAYTEMKNASILDDKDIDQHPPAQLRFDDHHGRVVKAMELLRKARTDISVEEEDPEARGLRNRAIMHINDAINHLKDAMDYWRY